MSISIESISFTYPNATQALENVSLEIKGSELVAIMGENGAGKTTLVKHLNGLLKPNKGKVLINGMDTKTVTVAKLAREVGFVFQNPDHQLFASTVDEEISFALKNFGFSESEINRRVETVIKFFELEKYRRLSPFILSGGERKRVALASVLALDPKILIIDEPTIGQDFRQKEKFLKNLLEMVDEGKIVIVVTHDVEFVVPNFHRIIVMSKGKVIADGGIRDVLTDFEVLKRASLLPPKITELSWNISQKITSFPKDLISVEDARKAILNLIKRGF